MLFSGAISNQWCRTENIQWMNGIEINKVQAWMKMSTAPELCIILHTWECCFIVIFLCWSTCFFLRVFLSSFQCLTWCTLWILLSLTKEFYQMHCMSLTLKVATCRYSNTCSTFISQIYIFFCIIFSIKKRKVDNNHHWWLLYTPSLCGE